MSATLSARRRDARKLVESIRDDNGYIPPEVYETMDEQTRKIVKHALTKKDERAGWSIVTLAENLYSSNARFVFELLQNCDDNHYSRARSRKEDPYVSFKVFPDRIVMASNEDGFTRENLHAICSVGKSSKVGAQGYIGEKGIGFKSVFMAAHKVWIQSREFSFFFQHRKGDSGLGMITPVWQDHDDNISDHLSQFVLYLHEDIGTGADSVPLLQRIRQQFSNLQDNILLFMKNLRRMEVVFYNNNGYKEHSITHSVKWSSDMEATVEKTIHNGRHREVIANRYLVIKHIAGNLSPNENRVYSEEEKASKAYSRSEIVLAFPTEADSSPKRSNQWVFAFLPVRQMGFKFVVQADFATEASRQDIVTTSPRNKGLGTGIADAFVKAILRFSNHRWLQWQWMRYIPQEGAFAWDGYWRDVLNQIGDRLRQTNIIQLDCSPRLRLLSDCMEHRPKLFDKHGEFLLPNEFCRHFVSRKYKGEDLDLLRPYGLGAADIGRCIEFVRNDLLSSSSKIKSNNDEDWQSRIADLVYAPFERDWVEGQIQAKQLPIIPLRDKEVSWISVASGSIYYPKVIGDPRLTDIDLSIPEDLGFNVVDPAAVKNVNRRRLFDAMGVQSAPFESVHRSIIERYGRSSAPRNEYCHPSHLNFLYMVHGIIEQAPTLRNIPILNSYGQANCTLSHDYYIESGEDKSYEASELVKVIEPKSALDVGAPGLRINFVNDIYFKIATGLPPGSKLTFKGWLHDCLHVRHFPRLVTPDGQNLSQIAEYVVKHRPEKFISFVISVWLIEVETRVNSEKSKIIGKLRLTPVLCEDGEKHEVRSSFLKDEQLEQLCDRFLLKQEVFPWIKVEAGFHENVMVRVSREYFSKSMWPCNDGPELRNIEFMLALLLELKKRYTITTAIPESQRICRIYIHLQAEVRKSANPISCKDTIRQFFEEHHTIFIPISKLGDHAWAHSKKCVWESHVKMKAMYPLAEMYGTAFERFADDKVPLADFFQSTLGICNSTWEQLITEIRCYTLHDDKDFHIITRIYECLASTELEPAEEQKLRDRFRSESLVAGSKDGMPAWFKSTECLWSSATRIGKMLALNEHYPGLQTFFVRRLGVQDVTPMMVYHKLLHEKLSVEDVKQTLLTFSSLITRAKETKETFDIEPMREKTILPVRLPNGEVSLLKCSDDFAVPDRQSLSDAFQNQAKMLEFNLDEVRALRPFLDWLGLEGRYLSRLVKEKTSAEAGSSSRISIARRKIKCKAHALLSVASAYNSPRSQRNPLAFYTLLKGSETLTSDGIISELHLQQGEKLIKLEKKAAALHIDHSSPDRLKIYVPRDEGDQDFCFSSELPQRFCEWMMTDPATEHTGPIMEGAVSAIKSILNVKAVALPKVLDHQRIRPADVPLDHDENSDSETFLTGIASSSGGFSKWASTNPFNNERNGNLRDRPGNNQVDSKLYKALLRKVVDAARSFEFPAWKTKHRAELSGALDGVNFEKGNRVHTPLGFVTGRERDLHIGAAGELFVFELLSRLNPVLPGFDRKNWESNIRHYARLHPDYQDIGYWSGSETADLTYMDESNVFTTLLINKGYLEGRGWDGAKIKYYMEVKTSTGPCDSPFFVNPGQYKRMQQFSNRNAKTRRTKDVYVIFRVYNIGAADCGVRVLVDPESLRQRDRLEFSADPWIVVAN